MRGFCVVFVAACLSAAAYAQGNADELIQVIRNNDLASLKARLAKGAQVNTRDQRGSTLLIHAAAIGSPEAVKLLLENGADVNARNDLEATALILGAGNTEKARMLVEKGADVNAHSKLGRTPLMIAAGCDGCSATVKLLLEKGADPNAKDKQGDTALSQAAWADNAESVRLLLAKGAGADTPDYEGYTPLAAAASNCNLEFVKLFLSKGANVNAANTTSGEVKFGKIQLVKLTPLMLAATYCGPDVVKTLLDAGAKVNDADIRGMTPIQFAVSSETQNPAVVKLLLQAGADDPAFVQSNPTWSPDGQWIVFARARAVEVKDLKQDRILLSGEEGERFLRQTKEFRYDLYRVPFTGAREARRSPCGALR